MEAIQHCLSYIRTIHNDMSSMNSSDNQQDPNKSIALYEYFSSFTKLTILDFFLVIFFVSFVLGVAFSFSEKLKSKTTTLVSIAFIGIIAFMSVKMVNQRVATDICLTCKGQNKMSYDTQLNVICSFLYANIQTFVGLALNVFYYFLVLYIVYILLRGHVLYSFGDSPKSLRFMSDIHYYSKADQKFGALPAITNYVVWIIYWVLIFVSMIGVVAVIIISIFKPVLLEKLAKLKLSFIALVLLPFFFSGITVLMTNISKIPLMSNIDKIIVQNVIPTINFNTITKSFDMMDANVLNAHIYALFNAGINSVLYAAVFLDPMSKEDLCTENKDINNENPKFDEFKNRFLMGHYVIGSLVILTYVAVLGGDIGKNIVIWTLVFFVLIYGVIYMSNINASIPTNDDDDE